MRSTTAASRRHPLGRMGVNPPHGDADFRLQQQTLLHHKDLLQQRDHQAIPLGAHGDWSFHDRVDGHPLNDHPVIRERQDQYRAPDRLKEPPARPSLSSVPTRRGGIWGPANPGLHTLLQLGV